MERLGASGRGPELDRRARPVPPRGPQGAAAGLRSGDEESASSATSQLAYSLKPTPPFRLDLAVWVLRRRPENLIDRWDGNCYRRALALGEGPVEVAVTETGSPDAPRLRITVNGERIGPGTRPAVTAALERLLGLRIDLTEFERFAAHDVHLGSLARRFRGMKPPRFPTVFECLVNGIACQQLSLSLGIRLLGRLAEVYGLEASGEVAAVRAFPRPEDLAEQKPEELRPLGFSHQKARALIELSRAIMEGRLDLESLAQVSDESALERLCQIRGVGRWTAEYVLLRGLGRLHVFPGDDVGARNNLQHWLNLSAPLGYDGVRQALARWQAYAGLIYFHLLLDRLAHAGAITVEDPPC
ncbi:MAG: DNA-3-methyladenine glycosylase family protein, partial [Isosphaeraceae bacterium]